MCSCDCAPITECASPVYVEESGIHRSSVIADDNNDCKERRTLVGRQCPGHRAVKGLKSRVVGRK